MKMTKPFYESIWWRSKCGIRMANSTESKKLFGEKQVKCIVPMGRLTPYDPFDYYYLPGTVGKGERSLPYLFADVSPEDIQALCGFADEFGIPGPFPEVMEWNDWDVMGRPSDYLKNLHVENFYRHQQRWTPLARSTRIDIVRQMSVDHLKNELYKFKNFLVLSQFVQGAELRADWILDEQNPKLLRGWYKPRPTTRITASRILEEMIAASFCFIRPRIRWDRKKWVWKWESLSLTSVMYLMVALDLQGAGAVRICRKCKRFFVASLLKKQFCSSQCQNREHSLNHWHQKGKHKRSSRRADLVIRRTYVPPFLASPPTKPTN